MDRNGSKEIKGILITLGIVIAGIMFLALLYMQYRYEETTRNLAELALQYPSAEGIWMGIREKDLSSVYDEELKKKERELKKKYGYNLLMTQESREFQMFLLGELLLMAGAIGGSAFYISRVKKKEREKQLQQFEKIKDCVKTFTEGYYDLAPLQNTDTSDFWDLREELGKLGNSMAGLKEKLEKEEKNTKTLITDISHQLKTPFSALKLSYEMMEDKNLTENERDEFFAQGKKELENLENLIEILLNMSRLEGNMIHLEPKPHNLKDTLLEAVNTVIMKAVDKNIKISAETCDCMVKHDFRWTQEAVINILDNAIKYSKPNTLVEIRMKKLTSYVLVEILDEGIGISSKEQNRIFQRYYRGNQAKEMERDGAGVGLYLSRKILEQQGGTICVKDRVNKQGSCFQIMLPLV